MEIPVIVERVIARKDLWILLACNLNYYSEKYNMDLEKVVKPYINEKYNTFTVVSNLLDSNENPLGCQYILIGDFIQDPKWGGQFKSEFYYQDIPSTEEGLMNFLMSLPNIKKSRSRAIIQKFGVEGTFEILDNDIYRLTEINGITHKRIPPIQQAWEQKRVLKDLYEWLTSISLSVKIAEPAYLKWGRDAKNVLTENPYKLVELRGYGFVSADKVAHQIMKDVELSYRTSACMEYILSYNLRNNSNLCLPYDDFKRQVCSTIKECDDALGKNTVLKTYIDLIPQCIKANKEKFTAIKDIENNMIYVYLLEVLEQEQYVVDSLFKRNQMPNSKKAQHSLLDQYIKEFEEKS